MWRSCPALKLHKEKPLYIALPSSVWNLAVRVPVIADPLRQLFSISLGLMKFNTKQRINCNIKQIFVTEGIDLNKCTCCWLSECTVCYNLFFLLYSKSKRPFSKSYKKTFQPKVNRPVTFFLMMQWDQKNAPSQDTIGPGSPPLRTNGPTNWKQYLPTNYVCGR